MLTHSFCNACRCAMSVQQSRRSDEDWSALRTQGNWKIAVMPRSAIIDPVTFTANRTGSPRTFLRTNSDRVIPIRSRWRFDGWPPWFNPVPVDIRSKLTAKLLTIVFILYAHRKKNYSFHSASIHPPSLAINYEL